MQREARRDAAHQGQNKGKKAKRNGGKLVLCVVTQHTHGNAQGQGPSPHGRRTAAMTHPRLQTSAHARRRSHAGRGNPVQGGRLVHGGRQHGLRQRASGSFRVRRLAALCGIPEGAIPEQAGARRPLDVAVHRAGTDVDDRAAVFCGDRWCEGQAVVDDAVLQSHTHAFVGKYCALAVSCAATKGGSVRFFGRASDDIPALLITYLR